MSNVSRPASQVVSAVGAFTAAGYIGWVAGDPIVGWVSQAYGAARGLQVLAVAAFSVAAFSVAAFSVAAVSVSGSERRLHADRSG
jgi:hypothetical protein